MKGLIKMEQPKDNSIYGVYLVLILGLIWLYGLIFYGASFIIWLILLLPFGILTISYFITLLILFITE